MSVPFDFAPITKIRVIRVPKTKSGKNHVLSISCPISSISQNPYCADRYLYPMGQRM
jgi:hypothetical protein